MNRYNRLTRDATVLAKKSRHWEAFTTHPVTEGMGCPLPVAVAVLFDAYPDELRVDYDPNAEQWHIDQRDAHRNWMHIDIETLYGIFQEFLSVLHIALQPDTGLSNRMLVYRAQMDECRQEWMEPFRRAVLRGAEQGVAGRGHEPPKVDVKRVGIGAAMYAELCASIARTQKVTAVRHAPSGRPSARQRPVERQHVRRLQRVPTRIARRVADKTHQRERREKGVASRRKGMSGGL